MVPEPPSWLDDATLRRLREHPCAGAPSDTDLRDRLWARFPALPLTAIDEATRFLRPDAVRTDRKRLLVARLARIGAGLGPPLRRILHRPRGLRTGTPP
jgi:hypothetical protein